TAIRTRRNLLEGTIERGRNRRAVARRKPLDQVGGGWAGGAGNRVASFEGNCRRGNAGPIQNLQNRLTRAIDSPTPGGRKRFLELLLSFFSLLLGHSGPLQHFGQFFISRRVDIVGKHHAERAVQNKHGGAFSTL